MALATKLDYREFWTLVGLSHVARDTDKLMVAYVRAAAEITGEVLDQNDYGHAMDMIYAPEGNNAVESVRVMLHKLGIVHEEKSNEDVSKTPEVQGDPSPTL